MLLTTKNGGRAALPKSIAWQTCPLPPIDYQLSPNRSSRTSPVRAVIVHATWGSYAGSIATLRNPAPGDAGGPRSAHLVLREDGRQVTQLVPWHERAWHARGHNDDSIGIELANPGRISLPGGTPEQKAIERVRWIVASRICAYFLRRFDIPPTWRHPGGITRHADCAGGSTDPMDEATWERFMVDVQRQYNRGGYLPWGVQ